MIIFTLFAHIILIFCAFALFKVRLKRNRKTFFLNVPLYILFYGLFYISLPSIVSLVTNFSWVGASQDTILATAQIGLYFNVVFLVGYALSQDSISHLCHRPQLPQKQMGFMARIMATIVFAYASGLILVNLHEIISLLGQRSSQSLLNIVLEEKYKMKPLYVFQIILATYLFLNTKSIKNIIYLLPFVLLSGLLSNREYILGAAVVLLVMNLFKGNIIKIWYLIISGLLIASISAVRSLGNGFNFDHLLSIFGEFEFTWCTTHLMYESGVSQEILPAFVYSIMRLLPSGLYNFVFGQYNSYTAITSELNPLGWGLAGSIVAEAIAFKSLFMTAVYPVLMVVYGYVINSLLRTNLLCGYIIFVLVLFYIQQMFRFSFLEFAMYPFYAVFYPGCWIVLIDFLTLIKRNSSRTAPVVSKDVGLAS